MSKQIPADPGDGGPRPARAASPSRGNAFAALFPVLIAGCVIAAYANSLRGPFVFDDYPSIVQNERLRQIWPPWETGQSPHRIVVAFTFAVNHALGRLDVRGYHITNLLIHIATALALFGVVRRTLRGARLNAAFGRPAAGLALAVAVLWGVHPLTTQAVTYVAQRYESAMALFFLLTLLCFIRGTQGNRWWYVVALLASSLGMCSKRIMMTAPVIILVYDAVFVAGAWREIYKRRLGVHLGLFATILVPFALAPLVPPEGDGVAQAGGALGLTPLTYALTQLGVVAHYLRLTVWPLNQCFDYAWPVARSFRDVWLPALIVGPLVIATVVALFRRPAVGFLGFWLFGILAPTSTILPIDDFAVEHRMYLPLMAVVAAVVLAGFIMLHRRPRGRPAPPYGVVIVLVLTLALGTLTHRRNAVYRSDISLWQDVVTRRPGNLRAHAALGEALARARRVPEAIERLEISVRMLPDLTGIVYRLEDRGVHDYATRHAITRHIKTYGLLGDTYMLIGSYRDALQRYRHALRVYPGYLPARISAGIALQRLGRVSEAITEYRAALVVDRNQSAVHRRLADALVEQGTYRKAYDHFTRTIELDPRDLGARRELAMLLAAAPGDDLRDPKRALGLARQVYETSGRKDDRALEVLGIALAAGGEFEQALEHAAEALRIKEERLVDTRPVWQQIALYEVGRPYRLPADASHSGTATAGGPELLDTPE
jgi:tetratricopeptide (TPR) repeat protein